MAGIDRSIGPRWEKMKIIVYVSSGCGRCPATIRMLRELLSERKVSYEDVVVERNISVDRDAKADLMMLNILSTPTVQSKDLVLLPDEATDRKKLRELIERAYSAG